MAHETSRPPLSQILVAGRLEEAEPAWVSELTDAGIRVSQVESGEKAIEWALEHYPELVLLAPALEDMDPLEVVAMLRELGFSKTILRIHQSNFASAGADDPLPLSSQPLTLANLVQAIQMRAPAQPAQTQPISRLQELTAEFEKSLPDTLATISGFLMSEQWDDLQRVVHQLKGCAGSLGHPRLTELAQLMLASIKDKDFFSVCAQYGEIGRYVDGHCNLPPR